MNTSNSKDTSLWKFWAWFAVAAVIMVNGAGFYYLNYKVDRKFSEIPPIAVIDLTKVAAEYPEGASESELNALMIKTNNAIVKLKDAGYLVIDAQAVLAAPDELRVDKGLFE